MYSICVTNREMTIIPNCLLICSHPVYIILILTLQVHRCLEKRAIGVILFADPQQYPDSSKRNKTFLLPSQLGMLQNMHGNPATEGASKLLLLCVISSFSIFFVWHIVSCEKFSEWLCVNYPAVEPLGCRYVNLSFMYFMVKFWRYFRPL